MGAEVVAIEEVKKYVDALTYLKAAFEINNLEVRNLSLYECTTPEFQDQFDYVLFAGVLYHLTDPVLGLRVVFNSLKDGGLCLLETAAIPAKGPTLRYEGPNVLWGGDADQLSRSGWNWFLPSTATVVNMLRDVGFENIRAPRRVTSADRQFAVARRIRHVDILRAGLSSPGIR
jgi:tRNA (mo5U34)-methyltransferase